MGSGGIKQRLFLGVQVFFYIMVICITCIVLSEDANSVCHYRSFVCVEPLQCCFLMS